ncbi:hypothetical protein [Solwaraspora sp. WMMA2101]|uniref:hypothetical protein n=1 Tax=Solwaraspora sp. WMMA2101 TaxID=3404124 RepID=UPI003B94254C
MSVRSVVDPVAVSHLAAWMVVMGVLYDYFRAAGDDAAVALIDGLVGGPTTAAGAVDAVDCKGIDPDVALGSLVAFVRGVAWRPDLVRSDLVGDPDDDTPWLLRIDDGTRDTLAGIDSGQAPQLSARWGRTDELAPTGPLPDDHLVPVIEAVAGLARRARDDGDHLYCWCSL